MEISKETIYFVIQLLRADNKTNQDIEDCFKSGLRKNVISLDDYCYAMEVLYGRD